MYRYSWEFQEFQESLEEAAEAAGLRLKKLDKKGERALVHSYRQTLQRQLASETDPAAALAFAIPLLIAQVPQSPHKSIYSRFRIALRALVALWVSGLHSSFPRTASEI